MTSKKSAVRTSKAATKSKNPTSTPKHKKRTLAVRLLMMPKDTNGLGNIFGGVLLSLMDLAGSHVSRRACKNNYTQRMVTRFMDKVEFKQAVHVNDVVSCYGTIIKIGNTSVTVQIEVEVDRGGKVIPVTSCDMVFVALDEDGKPTSVNPTGRHCATGKGKGKARATASRAG